ncbi:MAG: hypothetical protein ACHQ1G_05040 [Planctomycetota bacterium]
MRRLLIGLAIVAGCRSFEVHAFDVPVTREAPRLMAATDDDVTVWAAVAAVAIIAGFGVLFYNYGTPAE